jgi:hypothetical protein
MSVVVTPYVNSWVSIAQADDYFLSKYGCSAWASLTTADKTALILQAFREINGFPQFSIAATETQQIVKDAQCEFAWYVYLSPNRDRVFTMHAQGIRNYSASAFSQRLDAMQCPEFITKMLNGFLSGSGGGFMTITRDFDQW